MKKTILSLKNLFSFISKIHITTFPQNCHLFPRCPVLTFCPFAPLLFGAGNHRFLKKVIRPDQISINKSTPWLQTEIRTAQKPVRIQTINIFMRC